MDAFQHREISEAIDAADQALMYLNQARHSLNKAGNWGLVDLFGGGFLSTLLKHSHMDSAQRELEQARQAVRRFSRELQDVHAAMDVNLDTGDFLSFADYFFDGLIADWMVQSRISTAKRQVDDAIRQVERIRSQLHGMLNQ